MDYGDIIVHLFTEEGRDFYDLERIWRDGVEVNIEELHALGFEAVYTQLNRLFSKCHHLEKSYFGIKSRARFFNTPSMVGLFLLTISHNSMKGSVSRALKIEKILHYLQTGYGKNPCKGFGG